jgi:mycofactocin precursor
MIVDHGRRQRQRLVPRHCYGPFMPPEAAVENPVEDELLEDELLVEEISIDGMCGVY